MLSSHVGESQKNVSLLKTSQRFDWNINVATRLKANINEEEKKFEEAEGIVRVGLSQKTSNLLCFRSKAIGYKESNGELIMSNKEENKNSNYNGSN